MIIETNHILEIKGLSYQPAARQIIYEDGEKQLLSIKEGIIFKMLFTHINQVIYLTEIKNALWGSQEQYPKNWKNNIQIYIYRLRNLLKKTPYTITTIRSSGYIMEER